MTPSARVQAAIELLDQIIAAARDGAAAADTLIGRYFAERRYAGSKDRRAVRDLVYAAIRRAGERPMSGRAAMLGVAVDQPEMAALFDGSRHGPAPIAADEPVAPAAMLPAWLADKLAPEEVAALLARAPLDLRINRLKTTREAVMAMLPGAEKLRTEDGLRLAEARAIESTDAWRDGLIEIQDEGSQLVVAACQATPGMTVIDLCAGAGGKTLALGAAMAGQGRLIACDVDRARLIRLGPRAERAGLATIETRLLDGGREAAALADLASAADVVLVDAPCSGTGTWRRNPEARWRLTPDRLDRLIATQAHVLALAAPLPRPGGALIYAVCSLLPEEGEGQITRFLADHPGWQPEPAIERRGRPVGGGVLIGPARDGTDGFFIARLRRPC